MTKRIFSILTAGLIIVAIYQVFTLGYGCSGKIKHNVTQAIKEHSNYADEHLSVVYERKIESETDFVHLQIDTTYHKIEKGAYLYKIVCSREYSLRSFDGEYHKMNDVVAECFIGNNSSWSRSRTQHRQIMDYECERATKLIGGEPYEAWYTFALPYQRANTQANDDFHGLVLEARNAEGNYVLKAKYIGQQIG